MNRKAGNLVQRTSTSCHALFCDEDTKVGDCSRQALNYRTCDAYTQQIFLFLYPHYIWDVISNEGRGNLYVHVCWEWNRVCKCWYVSFHAIAQGYWSMETIQIKGQIELKRMRKRQVYSLTIKPAIFNYMYIHTHGSNCNYTCTMYLCIHMYVYLYN